MPNDPLTVAYSRLLYEGSTEPKRLSRAWQMVHAGRLEEKVDAS